MLPRILTYKNSNIAEKLVVNITLQTKEKIYWLINFYRHKKHNTNLYRFFSKVIVELKKKASFKLS